MNAVKKTTKIRRSKAPRDIKTVMEDRPPNRIASEIDSIEFFGFSTFKEMFSGILTSI